MAGTSGATQAPELRRAEPLDPKARIIEAFQTHDIVALGEGAHNNEQGHAFRLSLIQDPAFTRVVNDIVVEFGNARYQAVVDSYTEGGNVAHDLLRRIWQDAAVTGAVWDVPIYEEFLRAVRALNLTLPTERRLRVVLGDPPIDWEQVRSAEDYLRWIPARTAHPVDVIRREVLDKGRRALVVYGDGHLWRRGPRQNLLMQIVAAGAKVFNVSSSAPSLLALIELQASVVDWPTPALVLLRNTPFGREGVALYYPDSAKQAGEPISTTLMQEQFDAWLYLGDPSTITMSRLSGELCADEDYMTMRLGRIALMPGSQGQIDRIKQYCASLKRR